MTYEPKGCMLVWLAAMREEPERIWTSAEAAKVMGVHVRTVGSYAAYAEAAGVIHRQSSRKPVTWGLKPPAGGVLERAKQGRWTAKEVPRWNPGDDIRVLRVVPGWKPPQMVAPRG
jgi:hypothetical protein